MTIPLIILIFTSAYFGVKNIQLSKRNAKLEADVNFWRDLSFKAKDDLFDPKSVEFLRPGKK